MDGALQVKPDAVWNGSALRASFWTLNIGLSLMGLLTLLPLGLVQLRAALSHGYWYARGAETMGRPIVDVLVWMRVPGDLVFSAGALALAWFVLRLWIVQRARPVAVAPASPVAAITGEHSLLGGAGLATAAYARAMAKDD